MSLDCIHRNMKHAASFLLMASCLASCSMEPASYDADRPPVRGGDRLIVLCEGLWGMNNACMAHIDNGIVTDKWFQKNNPGMHLGDTGNDMTALGDSLIAVSVNWSNIIQYITMDGRSHGATDHIPNNRCLAADNDGHLYCTSFADNGYVAKIDLKTKDIIDTCHVGYEPEGIAWHKGRLFVANTGGYGTQTGTHGYETTVSVVDANTMTQLKKIDTGCSNLAGRMSQCGQFLCLGAAGDFYEEPPRCVILNMESEEFTVFDFPATYNACADNRLYALGSSFSYVTGQYTLSMHTVSLLDMTAIEGLGRYAAAETVIAAMDSPYGIYISPYSGHMYVSDARHNVANGYVYEFDNNGTLINKMMIRGLNPSRFIALP